MEIYDEMAEWPELKYLPNGKVKAKRWWWPPDRKKAMLLTVIINSDTFKKSLYISSAGPNPFWLWENPPINNTKQERTVNKCPLCGSKFAPLIHAGKEKKWCSQKCRLRAAQLRRRG